MSETFPTKQLEQPQTLLKLPTKLVAKWFAAAIASLVTVGAAANYAVYNLAPHPDHPIADVLKRFDLGHEPSIPAFYSSVVMLATAVLLLFLGRFDHSDGRFRRGHWCALAFLFLCLAIDEAVMFHEMASAALELLNLAGPFYFSWIIPGAVFAIVIGLSFSKFLLSLGRRTAVWLFLSGIIFVSGAIGMEFVAGLIFASAANEEQAIRSIEHVLVQAAEEGLEMIGVATFFCGLVDYLNSSGLRLYINDNSPDA